MDYDDDQRRILLVRVTELYKDTVRDLITGDDTCSIRQGKNGVVHVRGPMITSEEDGKIHQKPMGKLCRTPNEVVELVNKACESRRIGISTHHDQSSRSHLVMEFEVVTADLIAERNLFMQEEAELTRLKWLQTERMFGKHIGQVLPAWTNEYTNNADRSLMRDINKYEKIVNDVKENLVTLEKEINVGTTLVVCDLAGNEYARDAASSGSTSAEFEEAAEINKSLLAVKEMIRSLNDPHTKHVPYRDSKLSMMLKRHLEGGNDSSSSRAVMIGHISPSQQFIRKTVNTLSYTSMMGGNSRSNGSKNGGNKLKTTKSKLVNKKNQVDSNTKKDAKMAPTITADVNKSSSSSNNNNGI